MGHKPTYNVWGPHPVGFLVTYLLTHLKKSFLHLTMAATIFPATREKGVWPWSQGNSWFFSSLGDNYSNFFQITSHPTFQKSLEHKMRNGYMSFLELLFFWSPWINATSTMLDGNSSTWPILPSNSSRGNVGNGWVAGGCWDYYG
jgi:hypothetical protein